MAHFEKQLTSEEKFKGKVFRVTLDEVELENGHTSMREVVHHNGGAAIVALREDGKIAMVRQFRYSTGKELLEVPAGKVELGEAPLTTATRELEEEVGCTAESLVPMGEFIPTCGYCSEVIYFYAAKGLTKTAQHLDDDEFLSVEWWALEDVVHGIVNGDITDGKTVAAVLKAKLLLEKGLL